MEISDVLFRVWAKPMDDQDAGTLSSAARHLRLVSVAADLDEAIGRMSDLRLLVLWAWAMFGSDRVDHRPLRGPLLDAIALEYQVSSSAVAALILKAGDFRSKS